MKLFRRKPKLVEYEKLKRIHHLKKSMKKGLYKAVEKNCEKICYFTQNLREDEQYEVLQNIADILEMVKIYEEQESIKKDKI